MTWDPLHKNIVLFGGCNAGACPSNDTWTWDGATWTQRFPASSPPARFRHAMLYDSLHQQVVLFGGSGANGFLNDTWVWDGTNWTQKTPAPSPLAVPSTFASFAYDELHQQAILFSNVDSSSFASQTWSWDGNNWTQLNPSTVPPYSGNAILVYDRGRQQLVLDTYSDNPNSNEFASTWIWSGSNWVRKIETGQIPFDFNPSQGVYDPVTKQIIVMLDFKGIYAWDGSGWFLLPAGTMPASRILASMAFDEVNQQVVLFGGSGSGPAALANDTWTYGFPTLDWTASSPAASPPGRAYVGMTFDGRNSNVVLFGGRTTGNVYLNDTWTWNGVNWTKASSAQNPAPRDLPAMAFDAHNQQVVLFGGFGSTGPVSGYFADTWIWDGANWTLKTPAHSPPAQAFHSMVYDSLNQRVVLFGGVTCCNSGVVNDTWTWDGVDWTHQAPPTNPQETNSFSAAAFDAARNVTLRFVTAFSAGAWRPSTWTFNGSNWTALPPAHTPGARILDASLAYDGQRQQITLFGGADSNTSVYLSETWIWNGFDWTQINPAHNPSPRAGFGYAYDPIRNNTVLFGGEFTDASSDVYYNDTWTLAAGAAPSGTTPVTITVPAGVQFTFNGVVHTGTSTINIAPGNYSLSTTPTQLVAPGTQATFSAWSDAGAISHSVPVGALAVNISGTFTTQYQLTTVASPAGSGTLTGGGFYNPGAVASVTAAASPGFVFSSWSGACSGSGACSVTLNAPATVTANFVASSVQFTINVPPGIQFTFNGTTYTGTQTVTMPPGNYALSAPTPQSTGVGTQAAFASWSDGGAITHTVSLTLPVQSITGNFTTQYLLTTIVQPPGAGTVTPVSGLYINAGALVTLGESPNPGFTFNFWSGACSGSGVCSVTMNAPQTVTGNFGGALKWIQLGPLSTPTFRDLHGMVFDTARGETVLFGGQVKDLIFVNDTWTWNGANWTQKTPANSPSPRAGFAMAYDPLHNQTVMFGGLIAGVGACCGKSAETWIWDGTNWTLRTPVNSPSGRYGTRMAWDGSRIILFGGLNDGGTLGDTWAWDGSNWTQLNPATNPAPRWYPSLTFDAGRNQLVMFGGENNVGAAFGDTWIWNGVNWVQQNPGLSPPARYVAAAAYDSLIRQVVLFSGFSADGRPDFPDDLWMWDGAQWQKQTQPVNITPGPQFGGAMAYDEVHQQLVLFGGNGNGIGNGSPRLRETWIYANNASQQFFTITETANPIGAGTFSTAAYRQGGPNYRAGTELGIAAAPASSLDLESWSADCAGQPASLCHLRLIANGNVIGNFLVPPKWIQLGPVNQPPARTNAGFAFDISRGESVWFGGLAENTGYNTNETWTWDGTNWTNRSPGVSPRARQGHAMAYDPVHNVAVMFGGQDATFLGDTWIWSGAAGTWTQLSPVHSPSPRAGGRLEWDGTRLILFGGQTAAAASNETWAWDGSDWTKLAPQTNPPGRAFHSMTYDSVRKQIVMFGGETTGPFSGIIGDTWLWDGGNWTQGVSFLNPSPRSRSVLAFDGLIQKAVLFSGFGGLVANDTWLWDGGSWVQHTEAISPDFQWHSAMTYDPLRQQVVLFAHYAGDVGATWIYANNAVQQFVTLTVNAAPPGAGTAAGSGTYRAGSLVFASATPAAGYEFQGWTGACAGIQNPCLPTLSGNQTVTANFGAPLSWLKLTPGSNAAANDSLFFENPASLVYDSVRKQIVYFGGAAGSQTWIWNGTTWALRTPVHSPTPRAGAALAFDEARQQVVLFGGANSAGVVLGDTWTWDGNDWTQASTPVAPPVRANHSMAYDRTRQEVVLFGGWNFTTQFDFRTDTWIWNGTAWIQRSTPVAPGGRSDFGMAYDPVHQQIVISPAAEGGSDTWTWDGGSWQLANSSLPNAGGFRAMAYDQRLQRMVLVLEYVAGLFQTWVWDGSTWRQLAPIQSPPSRDGAGLAYDGVRGQILLFGGNSPSGPPNDTWVLAPPTAILTPQSFSAAKDVSGNYLVTTVLKNTGNAPANTVFALSAVLGTVTSFNITSPQFITIAPGATASIVAKFPPAAGPGVKVFTISGGYAYGAGSTGNWSAAARSVTLP